MEQFDIAREAVYLALNYQTIAGAATGNEQLSLYAASMTAAAKAQCYAKAAQSGDPAELAE